VIELSGARAVAGRIRVGTIVITTPDSAIFSVDNKFPALIPARLPSPFDCITLSVKVLCCP